VTFEQLHHLVAAAADTRLSPAYPAYELRRGLLPISRRSMSLAERQSRVLVALRQLGWPVFLRISEAPFGAELPVSWGHASRDTWAVPREVESQPLLDSLLNPGGWQLYLALEAVDPHSPLWRASGCPFCSMRTMTTQSGASCFNRLWPNAALNKCLQLPEAPRAPLGPWYRSASGSRASVGRLWRGAPAAEAQVR